jgi:hypothetical protein
MSNAETGKAVDDAQQVKAYEKAEDDYVVSEEVELDAVTLESVQTIDIDEVGEADTIEWTNSILPTLLFRWTKWAKRRSPSSARIVRMVADYTPSSRCRRCRGCGRP